MGPHSFAQTAPSASSLIQIRCESSLRDGQPTTFADLVTSSSPKAERFLRMFQKGLSARYQNRPELLALVEKLTTADLKKGPLRVEVKWPDTEAVIRKSIEGHRLQYTIESVYAISKGATLPTGLRARHPNLSLAKIFVAVTDALQADINSDPNLKSVEILAGVVVNHDLFELLEDLGFRIVEGVRFNQPIANTWRRPQFQTPMLGLRSFADRSYSDPPLRMDTGFGYSEPEPNSHLGTNLSLVFSVKDRL